MGKEKKKRCKKLRLKKKVLWVTDSSDDCTETGPVTRCADEVVQCPDEVANAKSHNQNKKIQQKQKRRKRNKTEVITQSFFTALQNIIGKTTVQTAETSGTRSNANDTNFIVSNISSTICLEEATSTGTEEEIHNVEKRARTPTQENKKNRTQLVKEENTQTDLDYENLINQGRTSKTTQKDNVTDAGWFSSTTMRPNITEASGGRKRKHSNSDEYTDVETASYRAHFEQRRGLNLSHYDFIPSTSMGMPIPMAPPLNYPPMQYTTLRNPVYEHQYYSPPVFPPPRWIPVTSTLTSSGYHPAATAAYAAAATAAAAAGGKPDRCTRDGRHPEHIDPSHPEYIAPALLRYRTMPPPYPPQQRSFSSATGTNPSYSMPPPPTPPPPPMENSHAIKRYRNNKYMR